MEFLKQTKEIFSLSWVQTICQFLLGGVFLYAGLSKIVHPTEFAESIRNFRIISGVSIQIVAYVLPLFEIIFGTLLILHVQTKLAAIFLSSLLVVFIIALIITLVRGLNINCGCFIQAQINAGLQESNQMELILRDIVFLIPGIIIIWGNRANLKPDA